MRRLRNWLVIVLGSSLWLGGVAVAQAATGVPPVSGPIVRGFDPPAQDWGRGHRGIDLLAAPGSPVRAVLAGRVVYAGRLAGRGVVVISHGDTRTTYEPLDAAVVVGQQVAGGEVIGTLVSGHPCPGGSCLHLGWRRDQAYLDPSTLFDSAGLRLLPNGSAALAAKLAAARAAEIDSGSAPGLFHRPVPGPIGSRFGMRLHPIFHVWRMHSGVDLSASCRTPIRAAASGTVIGRSYDSASGHRLTIDHGIIGGRHLVTAYLHASSYLVRVGQRVTAGQIVGSVGSTGWSTGCHLHFSLWINGRLSDPAGFL